MFTPLEGRLFVSFFLASFTASYSYQYQALFYLLCVLLGGVVTDENIWTAYTFFYVAGCLFSGLIRAARGGR